MKKYIYISLVLVVIAIGVLHFVTPGQYIFYHDTYRRLSYFPIVLGAIWFGVWGGLSLAVLSSIAFIPHLLLFMGQEPSTYLSELTEVLLYLAAGTVTGIITSKEAKLREKYKLLSEKLKKSYSRLHEETELLLEVEEQLSASQKFSALGQLSASLAHEIKNPLSSIKGTAEILLDEFPEEHPKREFVEILLKEIGRLNSTVEDVLQYAKAPRQGKSATESLAQVSYQVSKLLESHLRRKAITFVVRGEKAGEQFYVDGGKITQVLLNILLNSIEALPKKGTIHMQLDKVEKGLSITISDNGPGIPESEWETVFTPFYSGKEDGTGLGLSISRKIVESYGGTLTLCESDEGGACFTVFLPYEMDYIKASDDPQSH